MKDLDFLVKGGKTMITTIQDGKNIVIFENPLDLALGSVMQELRATYGFNHMKMCERFTSMDNILFLGTNPFFAICNPMEGLITDYVRNQFPVEEQDNPYEFFFKTNIPHFNDIELRRGNGRTFTTITVNGVEHNVFKQAMLHVTIPTHYLLAAHKILYPTAQHQLFVNHRKPSVHVPISKKYDANKLAQRVRPIMASIIKAQRETNKYLGYACIANQAIRVITNHLLNSVSNVIIGPACHLVKEGMDKRKGLKAVVDNVTLGSVQVASLLYALAYTKLDAEALCTYLFEDWDTEHVLTSKIDNVHYVPTAHFKIRKILTDSVVRHINDMRPNVATNNNSEAVHGMIQSRVRDQYGAIVANCNSSVDTKFKTNTELSDYDIIEHLPRHIYMWFKGLCKLTDIVWKEMFEGVQLLDNVKGLTTEELKRVPVQSHIDDILVNFVPIRSNSTGVYNQINNYFSVLPELGNGIRRRRTAPEELVTSSNRFMGESINSFYGYEYYNDILKEHVTLGNDHLVTTLTTQVKVMGRSLDFKYNLQCARHRCTFGETEIAEVSNIMLPYLNKLSNAALHDAMYRGYLLGFIAATMSIVPDSFSTAFGDAYNDKYYMFTVDSFISIKYFQSKDVKDRFTTVKGKHGYLSSQVVDKQ